MLISFEYASSPSAILRPTVRRRSTSRRSSLCPMIGLAFQNSSTVSSPKEVAMLRSRGWKRCLWQLTHLGRRPGIAADR
jgi:hypothetical protein